MKLFSIITFLILIFTSVIFADDDTLLVEYYICYMYNEGIDSQFLTFIEDVKANLVANNVEASFETNSIFTCNSSIYPSDAKLMLWSGREDDRNVVLALSSENISQVSPLLTDEIHLSVSFTEDYAPELIATLLMYQAGHYDIVEGKLFDLQDNINDTSEVNDINYYLGNIAILNGNNQLALERFENWRANVSEHSVNYGWLLIQVGEDDKAIQHITEMVDIWEGLQNSHEYSYWLSIRAQLHALTFDYIAAIKDMDTAIAHLESDEFDRDLYMELYHEPTSIDLQIAILYKQRGDIIMLIYEWNRALEDYNQAIELNPEYAEAYYRRGVLLYTMIEREDAIADFETYLELAPEGQFAESANEYIDSIQTELDTLGG